MVLDKSIKFKLNMALKSESKSSPQESVTYKYIGEANKKSVIKTHPSSSFDSVTGRKGLFRRDPRSKETL